MSERSRGREVERSRERERESVCVCVIVHAIRAASEQQASLKVQLTMPPKLATSHSVTPNDHTSDFGVKILHITNMERIPTAAKTKPSSGA